jgi:hypothetical protein
MVQTMVTEGHYVENKAAKDMILITMVHRVLLKIYFGYCWKDKLSVCLGGERQGGRPAGRGQGQGESPAFPSHRRAPYRHRKPSPAVPQPPTRPRVWAR